ncbi:MAG: HlyC/CorC family transporter [Chloroflexi bacterium]|nr:HlyC/CorC family transporter [Chloroflexota bacterium]
MTDIQVLLIAALLIINLVVTAMRAGLLNLRYARLLSLDSKQKTKVNNTIELVKQRSRLRISIKLAQSMLRFLIAAQFLTEFPQLETSELNAAQIITTLVILAFLIWFSELIIERWVLQNPESWAIRMTPLASLLILVLSPVLALPIRLINLAKAEADTLVTLTETELKALVDTSQLAGVLELDERQMLHSVFKFGDTLAREIMIPRIDMLSIDVNTPLAEAADVLLKSGYSRVPVYEGRIDNVLGLLYTKDMLKVWRGGNQNDSLRSLLRPAIFIPEAKKVDDLLTEMQAQRTHIAIVVDEYGGVAGLVTLEDIVEEIFGEIQDEYDEGEELLYQKTAGGEYIFLGRIDLGDFDDIMNSQLKSDEVDTLSGLIYSRLGRVPKSGETIMEGDILLTVEQVSNRRIRKVRASRSVNEIEKKSKSQEEHTNVDG